MYNTILAFKSMDAFVSKLLCSCIFEVGAPCLPSCAIVTSLRKNGKVLTEIKQQQKENKTKTRRLVAGGIG